MTMAAGVSLQWIFTEHTKQTHDAASDYGMSVLF